MLIVQQNLRLRLKMGRKMGLFDKGLENLNFDNPTPRETERHQEMAGDINRKSKSKNKDKYEGFVTATINQGINVENVFEDIPAKKRNLAEYLGYTALKGLGGKWVPLDNAKDSRIGKSYLEHYNRGRRVLGMINTHN